MKEWFNYAEALKPAVAQQVAAAPGGGVFDSRAMADLTAAIKDLASATLAPVLPCIRRIVLPS